MTVFRSFENGVRPPEPAYMHQTQGYGPASDLPESSQDKSSVDKGNDIVCATIEEREEKTVNLHPSGTDARNLEETSRFCLPMGVTHQSHEENPEDALSSPASVLAEVKHVAVPDSTCLEPRETLHQEPLRCSASSIDGTPGNSEGEKVYGYQSSSPIVPSSPLLSDISSPLLRGPSQSSPILVPSSPMSSSPPPFSSRPPSPLTLATPESMIPQPPTAKPPGKSGAGTLPKRSTFDGNDTPLQQSTEILAEFMSGASPKQGEREEKVVLLRYYLSRN